MISHYDVIIIGAGAAGLMCAMTAGQRGRKVLVIERANKIGKKILMSGGGRCNFTNLNIEANHYISHNPHFCKSALSQYTQWNFIKLVEDHGIAYHEKEMEGGEPGQLFCNDSAKQIVEMLSSECDKAKVKIITKCEIKNVSQDNNNLFQLICNNKKYSSESLVISSGGLSIPTLGGSDIGYRIAKQFGLNSYELRASLVPLIFTDCLKTLCSDLSGLSIIATVSTANKSFTGNLLFTHRGLSGPSILQLSNYWQIGESIDIDLSPNIDLAKYLNEFKLQSPKSALRTSLSKILPKQLVSQLEFLYWHELKDTKFADIRNKRLDGIASQLHRWTIKPAGSEGYRTAEVTLGGIDTDGISSKTMQAKTQRALFFIGEVLDVTGHLGGYNFQWAWSSGFVAGKAV